MAKSKENRGSSKKTIIGDLTIKLAISLTVIIIIFSVFNGLILSKQMEQSVIERLNEETLEFSKDISSEMVEKDDLRICLLPDELTNTEDITGVIIFDKLDNIICSKRFSVEEGTIIVREPIIKDMEILGYVEIHASKTNIFLARKIITLFTFIGGIFVAIIEVLVTKIILNKNMTPQLNELIKGVERISKGDYDFRLKESEYADLDKIFKQVNEMSETIQKRDELLNDEIDFRKNIELALRDSEKRYHTLFDDSLDAVYISTREGRFIDVNEACTEMLGYTRAELLNVPLIKIYNNPDDRMVFQKTIERYGFVKNYEIEFVKKNKEVMDCLLTATVRKDDEGNVIGYHGIIRDVTEQKKFRKDLIAYSNMLEDANQKLAKISKTKSEFISIASHELKTPLSIIKGYSDALTLGSLGELNQEQKKRLKRVSKNINQLSSLIDTMLDLSRIELGELLLEKRDFNASDVASDVVDDFLDLAKKKKITISKDLTEKVMINGDSDRIRQIFSNLIDNAIKYTPTGGQVDIILKNKKKHVEFIVSDNGVGIPNEFLKNIFKPFTSTDYSTKRRQEGVGLGLTIVKRLCDIHNAEITVKSNLGKGSEFKIIFKKG